jgi:transcriptional regulator with XRE-family HTH domain
MPSVCARFGRRVRELRERSGESQESFALRCGFGRSYYGRVERGEVAVSIEVAERIAKGLGVGMRTLFWFGAQGKKG